jgi:hypothetical protein
MNKTGSSEGTLLFLDFVFYSLSLPGWTLMRTWSRARQKKYADIVL